LTVIKVIPHVASSLTTRPTHLNVKMTEVSRSEQSRSAQKIYAEVAIMLDWKWIIEKR
jgi:hypothetical protein